MESVYSTIHDADDICSAHSVQCSIGAAGLVTLLACWQGCTRECPIDARRSA
jgi:hypothetical protein